MSTAKVRSSSGPPDEVRRVYMPEASTPRSSVMWYVYAPPKVYVPSNRSET